MTTRTNIDPMSERTNRMSQTEVPPSAAPSRSHFTEITPQALYDKCNALARNLWWSWHPEVVNLFRDLDPVRWRQLDHNPIALLAEMTPEQVAERAVGNGALHPHQPGLSPAEGVHERTRRRPGAHARPACLGSKPVAYFSAEFGIHESVPIYSGGLGVLSGDHIKSASGLGVPLVAIGLFYDQGYFRQHLDAEGYQQEEYLDTKVENLPMEPAADPDGKPITVAIDTRDGAPAGQGLADARRPRPALPAGLRRRRQQPRRPRADLAALRRRPSAPAFARNWCWASAASRRCGPWASRRASTI